MSTINSKRGYTYIVDDNCGTISLSPSQSKTNIVEQVDIDHNDNPKVKYLKNYQSTHDFAKIGTDDIFNALLCTEQIVFEITDKCNLKCEYCAYGHLYNNYSPRLNKNMDFSIAKSTIDYMIKQRSVHQRSANHINIGFYGGEPLLNFKLIEQIIEYTKIVNIFNRCTFYMTSNGILIKKYIPIISKYDFNVLISLDGDKECDSYRKFPDGSSSFEIVKRNIEYIKNNYPDFYENHIEFNSVIHNKNSVFKTSEFIYNNFHKFPMTNELSSTGVNIEYLAEFNNMHRPRELEREQIKKEINKCKNEVLKNQLLEKTFSKKIHQKYLNNFNCKEFNNSFLNLIYKEEIEKWERTHTPKNLPTGTCIPFSKKIFITVDGHIYPCERIGNEIDFGRVYSDHVDIDFEGIAKSINALYDKYVASCKKCHFSNTCDVCVLTMINRHKDCHERSLIKNKLKFQKEMVDYFEEHKEKYNEIMNELTLL